MNEFVRMVLQELQQSLTKAIFLCLLACGGVAVYYVYFRKRYQGQRKFPWLRTLLILALVGYSAILVYATMGRFSGIGFRDVNFHFLRAWREAWNNYSVKNWLNVLLNVAMFVPLGVLLPWLWKPMRKWWRMLPVGFAVSAFLEICQYLSGRGILDVDDLFANTLGAMLGFFAVMILLSAFGQRGKRLRRSLCYSGTLLVPILAIGGIFLTYELQEYGNLSAAPSFRANTDGVSFILACPLPEAAETAPVYRADSMSLAQCDAFGREFGQRIQADFHEILYYDKETYFIDRGLGDNGAHFLTVSYLDGGYDYSHVQSGYDEPEIRWAETDRETLEGLLAEYGITVPAEASFSVEGEGWHCFQAERLLLDGVLLDGSLRCRYGSGSIWQIENRLITYEWYSDEQILSPETAFQRLEAGQFSEGDIFERFAPEVISVDSCELTYLIDSKGFYQPVYRFWLSGENYQGRIEIPAMAS